MCVAVAFLALSTGIVAVAGFALWLFLKVAI
jgi:hypothetical protein